MITGRANRNNSGFLFYYKIDVLTASSVTCASLYNETNTFKRLFYFRILLIIRAFTKQVTENICEENDVIFIRQFIFNNDVQIGSVIFTIYQEFICTKSYLQGLLLFHSLLRLTF